MRVQSVVVGFSLSIILIAKKKTYIGRARETSHEVQFKA